MTVTADALYSFILANAEEIDGQLVCRASLIAELRRRDVENPGRVRAKLVRELSERGLVLRPHPRSSWLIVIDPDAEPGAGIGHSTKSFHHDAGATQQRVNDIKRYMNKNVLAGKEFICSSWGECKSSIGSDCTFKEGQLSHLGKHFDLSLDGRELRLVVVGQEVAGKGTARTTMAERYANVHDGSGMKRRFVSDADHTRRNPHMRGTTLALRTIFGSHPALQREGEFIDINGEQVHIFDCFALVNRLLCAAHLEGTSTGKSTKTMLSNCERHFRATLEILEPTIVVIQGVRMWKWSKSVLRPREKLSNHLFRCELEGRDVLVAPFTHPSARGAQRWDSPTSTYFKEIVEPTLSQARGHREKRVRSRGSH